MWIHWTGNPSELDGTSDSGLSRQVVWCRVDDMGLEIVVLNDRCLPVTGWLPRTHLSIFCFEGTARKENDPWERQKFVKVMKVLLCL